MRRIDLTAKRFGRLVVLEADERGRKHGSIVWRCQCDCGRETFVAGVFLRSGGTRSCGCLAREQRRGFMMGARRSAS